MILLTKPLRSICSSVPNKLIDYNSLEIFLLFQFGGHSLPTLDGLIVGLLDLFAGRKIDLIHYPSLKNPYFIEEVDETKVLLYEQNREEVSA